MIEVVIVGVISLIAVAIIIPSLGKSRTRQRQMQNSEQIRGLHQALVTRSQANKFWFAGATSTGKVDPNAATSNRHGSLMSLQDEGFFKPSYNISPGEIDSSVTSEGLKAFKANQRGSYAVLEYASSPAGANLTWLGLLEWRDYLNTTAVVMSDRQIGEPGEPRSIWATRPDQWNGTLCFSDNHVEFQTVDGPMRIRYGSNKAYIGTGMIGLLFECCDEYPGEKGEGRMVSD